MNHNFLFLPAQASAESGPVDSVFYGLVGLTLVFSLLIFALVVIFSIVYRQRKGQSAPKDNSHSPLGQKVEIAWTVIPLFIALGFFFWGSNIFLKLYSTAPDDALNIFVVGKQWMWKFEHPDGRREINEIHIPVGQPVRFLMVSQDVIHSMGLPDFRTKMDVLPMRYTTLWFTPTKAGKYHLYCNQYCGNQHSEMVGWVYAQTPEEYQAWLGGTTSEPQAEGSPAELGKGLMENLACFSCHRSDSMAMAPQFEGLFGSKVRLTGGQTVVADENYIRESILNPPAKVVAGFQPIMPSFQGRVTEDQMNQILTYLKSLGNKK